MITKLLFISLSFAQAQNTTVITEDGRVNAQMGIQALKTREAPDSIEWSSRRLDGWERWKKARDQFPRVQSKLLESYLTAVALGFSKYVSVPKPRFAFYVADTLNPSVWPTGGGFFVIHAGVIRAIENHELFLFSLALELAHETLGHNFTTTPTREGPFDPIFWKAGSYDWWPLDIWGLLVGKDPIASAGLSYSAGQESDALEIVYRFFKANSWNYEAVREQMMKLLDELAAIPGASSLSQLHKNFRTAAKLPHQTPNVTFDPVDSVVSEENYLKAREEMLKSTLQHYPWLLEMVPFRASMGSPTQFRERTIELVARDQLKSSQLARRFIQNLILMDQNKWKEVLQNSEEALKLEPQAEPFLMQKAQARQQLGQFNKCIQELQTPWPSFDHRRELLIAQCSFLEGRYSDAGGEILAYRNKYPHDMEGVFWEGLWLAKLQRPLSAHIEKLKSFWGDRPAVRALEIFNYAHLKQQSKAAQMLEITPDARYVPEEWGMLEFAQAWMRESFMAFHDDLRTLKIRASAEKKWPIARVLKANFPRDSVKK